MQQEKNILTKIQCQEQNQQGRHETHIYTTTTPYLSDNKISTRQQNFYPHNANMATRQHNIYPTTIFSRPPYIAQPCQTTSNLEPSAPYIEPSATYIPETYNYEPTQPTTSCIPGNTTYQPTCIPGNTIYQPRYNIPHPEEPPPAYNTIVELSKNGGIKKVTCSEVLKSQLDELDRLEKLMDGLLNRSDGSL
jgi:hypothetical protein